MPDTPILNYADLPNQWGVVCHSSDLGVVRVIVPPLPSWRHLHKGFFIGGVVLAVLVAWISYEVIVRSHLEAIPSLIACGAALFALALVAVHRLRGRLAFELDSKQLVLRNSLQAGSRSWPRGNIAEIRMNRSNGKLLIRVRGRELIDVDISPSREVTEYVAVVLNDALRVAPPRPTALATDSCLPPTTAMIGRAIGVFGFGVLFAASVVMMFVGGIMAVLGVYLMLFSVVPLGIAFGVHEKEFYV